MLRNNMLVVFAQYTFDDENCKVKLYKDFNEAKAQKNGRTINNHYMTVIGLYKEWNKNMQDYEYIMKVVSWGNIYYMRYDEYCEYLSLFCNILSVN